MAGLKKIYTIEIDLSQARKDLTDANKRVNQLQEQLANLSEIDQGGSFGAKIKEASEKAQAQVVSLSATVQELETDLADLSKKTESAFKPGQIGALREEAIKLKAALDLALEGSSEANALAAQLNDVRDRIKDIDQQAGILSSKDKFTGLIEAAQGLAGAFALSKIAAENLGISEEDEKLYEKRLTELIAVVQNLGQIQKLVSVTSRADLKALAGQLKTTALGWLGVGAAATESGAAATAASVTTKAALISTGIGAIIVAIGVGLGLVVSYWDDLTAAAGKSIPNLAKVKAVAVGLFDGAIESVKLFFKTLLNVQAGNISGIIADWKTAGTTIGKAYGEGFSESIAKAQRAALNKQADLIDDYIEIERAKGRDVAALERENLNRRVAGAEKASAEERKAVKALTIFRATEIRKQREDELAARLATLNAVASLESAQGKDNFKAQLAVRQEQLDQLLKAEIKNQAAIRAAQSGVDDLKASQDVKVKQKAQAVVLARMEATLKALEVENVEYSKAYQKYSDDQAQLVLKGAISQETAEMNKAARLADLLDDQAQRQFATQLVYERQRLAFMESAAQRDEEAIIKQQSVIATIEQEAIQARGKNALEALKARTIEQEREELLTQEESERRKAARLLQLREQLGKQIADGTAKVTDRVAKEVAEKGRIAALGAPPIGELLLIKMFGVQASKVDAVRESLNQSFATIQQSLTETASLYLDGAFAAVEEALDEASARFDEADKKLGETTSRREDAEGKLQDASGAKREFLLGVIRKERDEEEKLAAEKEKAAKAQAAAEKERQKLEVKAQQLSAATALASNVATAAKAVEAGVNAVSGAAALPFPANLVAVLAAVAAVGAAVASARSLGKSLKMANGGVLPGGVIQGGSHASGNDVPVFGGKVRVEGGEAITPVDATQKNFAALELIRTVGRTRTLLPEDFAEVARIRVLPPPTRSVMAEGGVLPTVTTPAPAGQQFASQASVGALEQKLDRNNALLEQVLAATTATARAAATTAAYGPARLAIGPEAAREIVGTAAGADEIVAANML